MTISNAVAIKRYAKYVDDLSGEEIRVPALDYAKWYQREFNPFGDLEDED